MIQYPYLKNRPSARQVINTFKGYNHNLRIGSGEFYEMENLTSDDHPVLSPRRKRGRIPTAWKEKCLGMRYVPGKGLYYVQVTENSGDASLRLLTPSGEDKLVHYHWLSTEPKQLVVMGAYLLAFPDRKWLHMADGSVGKMMQKLEINTGTLHSSPCLADGTLLDCGHCSLDPPENPQNGSTWIDIGLSPNQLKRYSADRQEWIAIDTTFVCLYGDGLKGHTFQEGDGIHITGVGTGISDTPQSIVQLNGCHTICLVPSTDAIVINGTATISYSYICDKYPVSIERRVPKMDFIVECGNRLWGCARDINEIYACKLGDFKNWNCFQGLSTDSWVGSLGTPGEFTGAAVQNGYPVFYKEDGKYKVWPSSTGAHQITCISCDGVKKGCENSLAVSEGTVFYCSAAGVCADSGGGPVEIGQRLGKLDCESAAGAVFGKKYYLALKNKTGVCDVFVYDLEKRLWHREDDSPIDHLAVGGGSLYAGIGTSIWDLTGNTGTPEEAVSWMAVTGDLGLELPEQKYISRLTLRLCLEPGATLEIYAQYDRDQTWVKLGQAYGTNLRSFSLPVRPRRCDQLRLKLQGTGMCKIYSITKTLEKGSELT